MEANMSASDVLTQLKQLQASGKELNKKKIKQSHPELMRNALFYFPSWEHAVDNMNATT